MLAEELIQDKSTTWKMFNKIANRYDLANRCLSLGIDTFWRAKVATFLPKGNLQLLDLGTGTGDFVLSLIKRVGLPRFTKIIGVDLADKMLEIARIKSAQKNLSNYVRFEHGDATQLTFADNSFNVVTMAFAIRNVTEYTKTLSEMVRVLAPGGKAFILEFSLPENVVLRHLYLGYFRWILPVLGGLITGSRDSYKYLNQSVEKFPYGEPFVSSMLQQGFKEAKGIPLTFGIATLYIGSV